MYICGFYLYSGCRDIIILNINNIYVAKVTPYSN